jgi:hypothetical protein
VQNIILRQLKPVIYQTAVNGERYQIDGHYVLDHRRYAFALGDYDHSRQLIIDPVFVYSTYLGGSGGDSAAAIAVDNGGNAYIAGKTTSTDFPTEGPIQSVNHNSNWGNAFVAKMNATGTALVYSTYLGGTGNAGFEGDAATAIAIDAAGDAYVAGYTSSTDFPTMNPFQATNDAAASKGRNAFVTKLNAAGNALVYSTYLGGSGRARDEYITGDGATAIAVDEAGNAYVAGNTTSIDFPTHLPFQEVNQETALDTGTAFITKLNAIGNALIYSTYLGGSATAGIGDSANAIAIDGDGSAYVVGATSSTNFPTVAAIQTVNHAVGLNNGGVGNAFVTKFNATGSTLVYSTYLGGSSNDVALAVAVDALGNTYVAGFTESNDFPLSHAWQAQNKAAGGGGNAFVTKFNAAGNALTYSTYLGGTNSDEASAIAVDLDGNAYVAGSTYSKDFPIADPLQYSNNGAVHGAANAFISTFNAVGGALTFSTYLGGTGSVSAVQCGDPCGTLYNGDSAAAVAVDNMGNLYVTGSAYSTDFPTVTAFQGTNKATNTATGGTAFVTKISLAQPRVGRWGFDGGGGAIGWAWISVLVVAVAIRYRKYRELRLPTI